MERQVPKFRFCLYHTVVLWPWALHLLSLGLSFRIYKKKVKEFGD